MVKKRTIGEINERLKLGKAIVMTASELSKLVRAGEKVSWEDVDVVTSATCGLMSGSTAILSFPFTERGKFTRAKEVLLNGVPCYPGPCPNERLGEIDLVVYGTQHSVYNEDYGGGHLFKDIACGKTIKVEVRTAEGRDIEGEVSLEGMTFARFHAIRNCFKNYIAMLNKSETALSTIFHVKPIQGPYRELSVCGCGEMNPIANDPKLDVIGVGTKVLINGAEGFVTGLGTRATEEKPNLTGFASLRDMDPLYMGGFRTAEGPEVIASWAVPIPILDENIFNNVCSTDSQVPLPIADIIDRIPFTNSDYGKVWEGTDHAVRFSAKECLAAHEQCAAGGLMQDGMCPVERICPTNAFTTTDAKLDRELCFNCGSCVSACAHGCFRMEMGSVEVGGRKVPITIRQSDRVRAERLARDLKARILDGSFTMTEKVGDLTFSEKDDLPCRFCDRQFCKAGPETGG